MSNILRFVEYCLICAIFMGMIIFVVVSTVQLTGMDWWESDTYFLMLRRVLALIIGIELIRFLSNKDMDTLLEVLIFLLARQLLLMEINEQYEYLAHVVIGVSILIFLGIGLRFLKSRIKI